MFLYNFGFFNAKLLYIMLEPIGLFKYYITVFYIIVFNHINLYNVLTDNKINEMVRGFQYGFTVMGRLFFIRYYLIKLWGSFWVFNFWIDIPFFVQDVCSPWRLREIRLLTVLLHIMLEDYKFTIEELEVLLPRHHHLYLL